MGQILVIESAVSGFSVAVHQRGLLLASIQLNNERVASSHLTSAIDQVLAFSQVTFADLDAIAVSAGPGSYTGLRVGVATAKGLCFARELPLIAVNTLEIMAHGVNFPNLTEKQLLCPMIDARRMEVYCSFYTHDKKQIQGEVTSKIVDAETFLQVLEETTVLFFGNGSQKIESLYAHHPNALFLPEVVLPLATFAGQLAYEKFIKQAFEDLPTFEPDYLKPYFATKPKNQLSPQ